MYLHGAWNNSLKSMHYKYKHTDVFTNHLRRLKDNRRRALQKRKNTDYREENLSYSKLLCSESPRYHNVWVPSLHAGVITIT